MQRARSTVIVLVGDDDRVVARLREAPNVAVIQVDPDRPGLDRAVESWRAAQASAAPFVVSDVDPLARVAESWVRYFDEQAPVGELEVAVADTLARWRTGSIELPDYYVVIDPETWAPTRRHWFLGFLADAARVRVVPAAGDAMATIAGLPTGPWWPELDRLLDGIERAVPDRTRLSDRGKL
ncbi:MAG TPA: hypothetical protein VG476_09755 [Acidimicrobiales bacterium]|nr:hypothetical protein [Acidimicrobiales bacterium]